MQRALLLAGACALWAAPAFSQSPPAQSTPPSVGQETAEQQPAQSTPSTADFVKAAAISDLFEIQSSKLALKKKAAGEKTFAEHMIHDHSMTTAQLKRMVKSGRVKAELPAKLDDQHQQMLDQLRSDNRASFDKDYDQMQLRGHQQAVAMFEAYAKNGDNPALKHWASQTLPKLQDHLAMAEKLSGR